jgi:hypothetical protein
MAGHSGRGAQVGERREEGREERREEGKQERIEKRVEMGRGEVTAAGRHSLHI